MENLSLSAWIGIVLGVIAIVKFGVDAINSVRNPNIEQDKELIGMKKDISATQEDIKTIKENHLFHIERDMGKVKDRMVKIETILDERLPAKK